MKRTSKPRVMVIGFDSASWMSVDPLLEAGRMPNLNRLVENGVRGALQSTIPYVSAPAWASFATGSNPGRHGVFDFMHKDPRGYGMSVVNANSVRLPTLWDLLSAQGLRVGVLNVPVTFPPRPVNGAMVTGVLTPDLDSEFTHPPELKDRLLTAIPDYILEPTLSGIVSREEMKERLLRETVQAAERRADAARLLLDEVADWDFFAVIFTGLDRLQHYLWDDADPHHPLHDPASAERFGGAIEAHYEQLDRLLGELLEEGDSETTVIVMSDHGMTSVHQFFFPNQWLAREGYLHWHRRRASDLLDQGRQILRRIGLAELAKKIRGWIFPGWEGPRQLRSAAFARDVDWAQTRVFWATDNGFWLNVKGREPRGIIDPGAEYDALCAELKRKLLSLRDPMYDQPVISEVWRRDELYDGPYTSVGPDLRVVWNEIASERRAYSAASELWGDDVFGYTPIVGDHVRDGVLVASGRGTRSGEVVQGATLLDLAPTILYLLAQPVPDHMDGQVLWDLLDPALASAQTEVRESFEASDRSHEAGYTGDEEIKVEQRLHELGYL